MHIKWSNFLDKVYGFWVSYGVSATNSLPYTGFKGPVPADGMSLISDFISQSQWFDMMILYVNAVKKYGTEVNGDILSEYFTNGSDYSSNEGAIIRLNYTNNILKGTDGTVSEYFHSNSSGAVARAPFWGTMFPGSPKNAAHYAEIDASIAHTGAGIYGASYIAAVFAIAYTGKSSIKEILVKALDYVDSAEFNAFVRKVFDYCEMYNDIETVCSKIISRYGCPNYSDVYQNLGIIIASLILGEGDFASTFVYSLSCGYDTVVNSAVSTSLIGVISGGDALHFKFNFSDIAINPAVSQEYSYDSLKTLADDTAMDAMIMSDSLSRTVFKDNPINDVVNPEITAKDLLSVSVKYSDGNPFIQPDSTKEIIVNVSPNYKTAIKGTVKLRCPEFFTVKPNGYNIKTKFFDAKLKFTISMKKTNEPVNLYNYFTIETVTLDDEKFTKDFSLLYRTPWKLFGPFSENISNIKAVTNGKNYVSVLSENVSDSTALSNIASFRYGSRSDISIEYLEEQLLGNQAISDEYMKDSRYMDHDILIDNTHFALEDFIYNKMPSVSYMVKDFYFPEAVNLCLHVGYSDPFRLWIDGDLVSYSDDGAVWSPDNKIIKNIRFERGKARFVFKVSKNAGKGEYSLYFTENGPDSRIFTDYCDCII